MAERPMNNKDDDLFNYQPLQWVDRHRKLFRAVIWRFIGHYVEHKMVVMRLELAGEGVSIDLHANGTWTLEDTTGG